MFNFLGKLAFVIIAFYALSYTPIAKDYMGNLKTAFLEKIGNVMAEVDRVSGEIDEAKQKIDDTKEKVENAKNTVTDAAGKIKETADTIQKAADAVGDFVGGDEEAGSEEAEITE